MHHVSLDRISPPPHLHSEQVYAARRAEAGPAEPAEPRGNSIKNGYQLPIRYRSDTSCWPQLDAHSARSAGYTPMVCRSAFRAIRGTYEEWGTVGRWGGPHP
jgi:hypothetical protein